MPQKDTSIYSWSTNPTRNQSYGNMSWYEGMPPSQVNNSARAMCAAIAAYIQDQNYANTNVTFGANNIQVTINTPITKLIPGMVVKFGIPTGTGTAPDSPLLKINNLSAQEMDGNTGDGLPIVYETFNPSSGTSSIQAATSLMFTPGSLITLVYRPDIKTWTLPAYKLEQSAAQHLSGDIHGLLKADAEWANYSNQLGVFMMIDSTGAQSASTMLAMAMNQVFVGQVGWFDADGAPSGWVVCDGSEIKDEDYPLLAKVLNKRHGGTLTTTILPDLRQMFIRGYDGGKALGENSTDADKNTVGVIQKEMVGSFELKGNTDEAGDGKTQSTTQMPLLSPGKADGGDNNRGVNAASWANTKNVLTGEGGIPKHLHSLDITYTAYENRPANMALVPCIFAGIETVANSGAIGFKGQKGDPGVPGAPGRAATIAIVETDTLAPGTPAAMVEADGSTPQDRKYKAELPAGAKGDTGTPGAPGNDGDDGKPGAAGKDGTIISIQKGQ